MTTKTRYFMLGSFAVIVAGLCTGLFAYYGGLPIGALGRSGPAELAYVPADAAVVAYADVKEVMGSELRKRLRSVMPAEDEAKGREEFKAETGIDLETDIDHIVAAMIPRGEGQLGWESGFVAFRGNFDQVRLESLAREHGATVDQYKGKRIIRLPRDGKHHAEATAAEGAPSEDAGKAAEPPADARDHGRAHPRPNMVVAFAEPGLVIVGDEQAVKQAIDTAASGRDVTSNADVMRLVRDLEGGANAWAVGRFDLIANQAKLPEGLSAQMPAIKWFAAAGRVNGGISGSFRAEARDEEAARNLRDVANGFLALARMQAGSRPELQAALQSLQLTGSGTTVQLSFQVPAELFDVIAKAHGHKADTD
jgi:hypothetical protein